MNSLSCSDASSEGRVDFPPGLSAGALDMLRRARCAAGRLGRLSANGGPHCAALTVSGFDRLPFFSLASSASFPKARFHSSYVGGIASQLNMYHSPAWRQPNISQRRSPSLAFLHPNKGYPLFPIALVLRLWRRYSLWRSLRLPLAVRHLLVQEGSNCS